MDRTGSVDEGCIKALLHDLDLEDLSGTLRLASSRGTAHLHLRRGRVIAARAKRPNGLERGNPFSRGAKEGVAALVEICGWNDGEYTFEPVDELLDPLAPRHGNDLNHLV